MIHYLDDTHDQKNQDTIEGSQVLPCRKWTFGAKLASGRDAGTDSAALRSLVLIDLLLRTLLRRRLEVLGIRDLLGVIRARIVVHRFTESDLI